MAPFPRHTSTILLDGIPCLVIHNRCNRENLKKKNGMSITFLHSLPLLTDHLFNLRTHALCGLVCTGQLFLSNKIVTNIISLTGCLFVTKGKPVCYKYPCFLTNHFLSVRYWPYLVWECSRVTKGLMKSIMYHNLENGEGLLLVFSGYCEPF